MMQYTDLITGNLYVHVDQCHPNKLRTRKKEKHNDENK